MAIGIPPCAIDTLPGGRQRVTHYWQRGMSMKKIYQKPVFTKRERLSSVTASPSSSGIID